MSAEFSKNKKEDPFNRTEQVLGDAVRRLFDNGLVALDIDDVRQYEKELNQLKLPTSQSFYSFVSERLMIASGETVHGDAVARLSGVIPHSTRKSNEELSRDIKEIAGLTAGDVRRLQIETIDGTRSYLDELSQNALPDLYQLTNLVLDKLKRENQRAISYDDYLKSRIPEMTYHPTTFKPCYSLGQVDKRIFYLLSSKANNEVSRQALLLPDVIKFWLASHVVKIESEKIIQLNKDLTPIRSQKENRLLFWMTTINQAIEVRAVELLLDMAQSGNDLSFHLINAYRKQIDMDQGEKIPPAYDEKVYRLKQEKDHLVVTTLSTGDNGSTQCKFTLRVNKNQNGQLIVYTAAVDSDRRTKMEMQLAANFLAIFKVVDKVQLSKITRKEIIEMTTAVRHLGLAASWDEFYPIFRDFVLFPNREIFINYYKEPAKSREHIDTVLVPYSIPSRRVSLPGAGPFGRN